MTGRYRYATVLRALNDGQPPNDGIEAGDEILKPGKHAEDKLTYLTDDLELAAIRFEQVEVLDAGEAAYTKSEIERWAESELFGDGDPDG